jgi:hypothetical membrane protein
MIADTKATQPTDECLSARAARVTRSLLGYGVLAGPFYVLVVLGQALLRPGFDLAHDDASLLSNGPFGWIQVANFVLTGAMVLAFAAGLRRAFDTGRGKTWGPLLVAIYGLGLVGAGIFSADPMNGFPIGTPAGRPAVITTHGVLHIVVAGLAFLALVAACLTIARRYAAQHLTGHACLSVATGIIFLLAFVGVASGSSSAGVVLAFWFGLLLAWSWMATVAIHEYRTLGAAAQAAKPGVER